MSTAAAGGDFDRWTRGTVRDTVAAENLAVDPLVRPGAALGAAGGADTRDAGVGRANETGAGRRLGCLLK